MLKAVDLGYLFSQDTVLGKASMAVKVNGSGYDYKR